MHVASLPREDAIRTHIRRVEAYAATHSPRRGQKGPQRRACDWRQRPGSWRSSSCRLRVGAGQLRVATCRRQATLLGLSIPEALVLGLDESPMAELLKAQCMICCL